ncbi:MAG: hypothetical protein LBU51_00315 [Bacteroidales bacterium]|jgi:hypothetical protein|nr:hypothetical protein [Bacteroidales bacterium]
MKFTRGAIPRYIKEMSIEKYNQNILHPPLDTTRWVLTHTSKYNYHAILTVNPEDFE